MIVPSIDTSPAPAPGVAPPKGLELQFGVEKQVQNALNLYLPMKNPTQMPALLALLLAAAPKVHDALAGLHYAHELEDYDGTKLDVSRTYRAALEP